MRKLIIIGAGGFGREVHAWATQASAHGRDWNIKGFLDDDADALFARPSAGRIIGPLADYEPRSEDVFVCAIGRPAVKRRCAEIILSRGGKMVNVIHPSAVLSCEVKLGWGVIVCPYAVISANTTIGNGVGINLHVTVGHDAIVGDWCQVNCHSDITGGVVLDSEVFVGSHACILPKRCIGRGAVIGAGAVVMSDVSAGVTAAAAPARPFRL